MGSGNEGGSGGGRRFSLENLQSSGFLAACLLGGLVLGASVLAIHLGTPLPFPPQISALCVGKKKKKPVRVYMDGCFDMMHYGHCNALRQAKALGDQLVVGVVSDAEIIANKGPPVTPLNERFIVVACWGVVPKTGFFTLIYFRNDYMFQEVVTSLFYEK